VNPPALQIDHPCRISVLEPNRIWSLRGDVLWMLSESYGDLQIPLASLTEIRLVFSPTRVQTNRYRCLLFNARGKVATIQNEHYAGVMDFEDRSESYRALVITLIHRTAMANPGCRFTSGNTLISYLAQVTVLLGGFLILAAALYLMSSAISSLIVVKLILILVYIPVAVMWMKKNKPAIFSPDAPPENLLPKKPESP
jgi:hypothetical protein